MLPSSKSRVQRPLLPSPARERKVKAQRHQLLDL
jgi:hypothetical protein